MPSEVEEAVRNLKADKSPLVNNLSDKLLKHGGEAITQKITTICHNLQSTNRLQNINSQMDKKARFDD
jgi:transcriptional regulator of NAD metabolism